MAVLPHVRTEVWFGPDFPTTVRQSVTGVECGGVENWEGTEFAGIGG